MKRSVVIAVGLPFLLAGCFATVEKKTTLEVESGMVTYTLPSDLYETPAQALPDFKKGLAEGMISASNLAPLTQVSDYREAGMVSSATNDGVMLSYVSEQCVGKVCGGNIRNKLHNNFFGKFSVVAESTPSTKDVVVTVTCPNQLENDARSMTGEFLPYISADEVKSNIAAVCKRTNVAINKRLTGSVDTRYPEASVFANFERKLRGYKPTPGVLHTEAGFMGLPTAEAAKYKWFYLNDEGRNIKVAVAVYPYRNGSKVNYTYVLPVSCKPNARCDFKKETSQRIHNQLASVAND